MASNRKSGTSHLNFDDEEEVLYKTFSMCPKCILLDRKALDWKPAAVFQRKEKVWLRVICSEHGFQDTLYCSNVEFFKKTMSFSFDVKGANVPNGDDIEDLKARINYTPSSTNLPMALELSLWENGDFVSDEVIKERVNHFKSLYPPNRQFVLKVLGRLATNMEVLNKKVLYVESLLPSTTLMLETSYERLCLLCKLDNSAFLRPSIYPALKYYLRKNEENRCKEELTGLFEYLKTFTGIQLMVTICVSRPYPVLNDLLRFMREQYGFIRVIVISMERSPKELYETLSKKEDRRCGAIEGKMETNKELNHVESNDVYELLEHIQKCSYNSITVDDFCPMSVATAMEPFLNLMGYGLYYIRPSPFCGFATCLVNTDKSFLSYPVTRLFDFEQLFNDLKPLVPKMQDGKIGLLNAQKLKKIFTKAQNPNKGPLPDLYAYLTEKSKANETKEFIQNLQFIIVHNNMDIASLDFVRRCNCAVGTTSTINKNQGLASYCSGCV